MSEFTEARSEPRYPIKAGFVEIADRAYPLHDLSTRGLGFRMESLQAAAGFTVGGEIDGFLVLQMFEEQYEMPVRLTVRRVEEDRVGCSMVCPIPHHAATIEEFLASLNGSPA
jgi:hypothetical protein